MGTGNGLANLWGGWKIKGKAPKNMNDRPKPKSQFNCHLLCLAIALFLGMGVALAGDSSSNNLSAADILKKAQEKYAALTSYSDEGKVVASLNGMTMTTTFTIRLARPNLYQVKWEQSNESAFSTTKNKPQVVWSDGNGDYLEMFGHATKQTSMEMALASATGISGGAASTIPGTFFKMNWGNQLNAAVIGKKQQSDEKVDGVDCYVFTSDSNGTMNTLWIGKQDFLIHQVRNVTSAKAMKAAIDEAAKEHPEITNLPEPQGMTSTETHVKIVLNPKFSSDDFAAQKTK